MNHMPLQPFTRNYQDDSSEAGFQFTFLCDICSDGYKTAFIQSKTYKKAGLWRGLGRAAQIGGQLTGHSSGYSIGQGADMMSDRFQGMTPEWHKEHEQAFASAQNEVKSHFHRCPKCKQLVCDNDWNEEASLCVSCAPLESVEVAAAHASKMVEDIQTKASTTQVFKGEINARQALCPKCKKPAGEGKFCSSCGANLALGKCPSCGAANAPSASFCNECGAKLK
jgi:membrane protease subunit (stomatin/prohibitin family)